MCGDCMKKVIVIGGGASGLVAAINLSKKFDVTILERNSECAKKILMTGNGKCNYFNWDINIKNYYTDDYNKLETILSDKNQQRVLKFFDDIGVIPRIKNGYYYPYSNQATTIRTLLLKQIENRNIKVINNIEVESIEKVGDIFIVESHNLSFKANKVVLATGSIAGLKNVNEIGINIASNFFKVISPLPALVQLKSKEAIKNCNGVRCDAILSLYIDNKLITEESGEIQITDYGISGICTLNISSIVSRSLGKNIQVKINFMNILESNFLSWMDKRCKKLSNYNIVEVLESLINYKIIYSILKKAKIKKDYWLNMNQNEKELLKNLLFAYPLEIIGTNDFTRSQVMTGGVSLKDINPLTMESKIPNLYITGELLNVDGKCGGFNLGFAWITGMIVGDCND